MVKQIETDEFIDPRDGKAYKTVKIGEQVWLAENLNWEGAGVIYENKKTIGKKYGRLYTWAESLTVAPPGWHLPTDAEWQQLVDFAGGNDVADNKLKAKNSNGTDDFGFSVLLGGTSYGDSHFNIRGQIGCYWSATEYDSKFAYYRCMIYGDRKVCGRATPKNQSFSVRLIKN